MFSPPTFNSFLSLCITNFIVQVIVLNGPSKPANTNSVFQNFKNLGKDIFELPHFRVCPPHFLERIVALVKGQAINLLKSYLTNRKQKCQIRNSFSSERLIKCGVPQGSILGPLLFLLYINDLPHCLSKTKPRLFADDTNLTASANCMTDLEAAVNSDLENLRKWLIANKLRLNVAKTEFILIGSKSMIQYF